MAKPQKENGYTPIANEIMERISKIRLTDYQSRVLHALWRKTYGYQKKSDVVSLSQWAEATNIARHNVFRTLKELASRQIIIIKHINPRNTEYLFQKDYDLWDKQSDLDTLFSESVSNEITSTPIVSNVIASPPIVSNISLDSICTDNQMLSSQIPTKENIQKIYTKENNNIYAEKVMSTTEKNPYGEFQNILLTNAEHQKLIDKFGDKGATERIENASASFESHKDYPKKYKSHYATILSWDRLDEQRKHKGNGHDRPEQLSITSKYKYVN